MRVVVHGKPQSDQTNERLCIGPAQVLQVPRAVRRARYPRRAEAVHPGVRGVFCGQRCFPRCGAQGHTAQQINDKFKSGFHSSSCRWSYLSRCHKFVCTWFQSRTSRGLSGSPCDSHASQVPRLQFPLHERGFSPVATCFCFHRKATALNRPVKDILHSGTRELRVTAADEQGAGGHLGVGETHSPSRGGAAASVPGQVHSLPAEVVPQWPWAYGEKGQLRGSPPAYVSATLSGKV